MIAAYWSGFFDGASLALVVSAVAIGLPHVVKWTRSLAEL